jgi:hypothetical protein
MRALTIVLGVILATLSVTEVSAMPIGRMPASEGKSYSCRIISGYGTAIGQGQSKLQAKEVAREICGEKMIDGYIAQRGSIPDEVIGDLTTACINKECE